jgi:hypothetical protein
MKYAAIVKASYYVPGDERSRTNPGHGYPTETVSYHKLVEFDNEDTLKNWLLKQPSNSDHRVIVYSDLEINLEIQLTPKQ